MSRVLLIRSLMEALPLTKALKLKGLDSVCYPLFEPQFLSLPLLDNPQALLITSKNALRAIESREDLKKVQLYVVGDQTAQLAEQFGFFKVMSASGTSQELQELILSETHPGKGVLYHLSGEIINNGIVKALQSRGFQAVRHIVYRIQDIEDLPEKLVYDILHKKITHVMFFSPRTTLLFATLLKKCKIESTTNRMIALCFSSNVAKEAEQLSWEKIWISPRPNLQNMLEYFDDER